MPVGKVHELRFGFEVLSSEAVHVKAAVVVDEAVAAIRHCMPLQAAVGPPLRSLSRLFDPVDSMQLGVLICTDQLMQLVQLLTFSFLSVRTDSLVRDLGIGAFESVVIHCSFGSSFEVFTTD